MRLKNWLAERGCRVSGCNLRKIIVTANDKRRFFDLLRNLMGQMYKNGSVTGCLLRAQTAISCKRGMIAVLRQICTKIPAVRVGRERIERPGISETGLYCVISRA